MKRGWLQWVFNTVGLAGLGLALIWVGEIRTTVKANSEAIDALPAARQMERLTIEDSYAALYRANAERIANLERLHMEP